MTARRDSSDVAPRAGRTLRDTLGPSCRHGVVFLDADGREDNEGGRWRIAELH